MALPTLNATFASSANLPRKQMLAKWLVEELGETQAPSNVLVSGLDDYYCANPNGNYTYFDTFNGKPRYQKPNINLEATTDDIYWNGSQWEINVCGGDVLYFSIEDVAYPWLVASWDVLNGSGSIALTEIPQPSPLSNYYSLPERYLWAKIAVAAGGPKTEADYISLPKNYAWSDIYNAVSGDIANSTVVVSGLSDSQYNGSYVYDGLVNGRASYRLNENILIFWDNTYWVLTGGGDTINDLDGDKLYPWLVASWEDNGINPSGLVMTPQTPNHTDWSEKQALGHIAAAYRGDTANPANLATYIDWPWRYQVASIIDHLIGNYNAVIVSGAGSTELNGTYTNRGTSNGKSYYNLIGSPDNIASNAISFDTGYWRIFSFDDGVYYEASSIEDFPWDATGWTLSNGTDPVPTLTPTNV